MYPRGSSTQPQGQCNAQSILLSRISFQQRRECAGVQGSYGQYHFPRALGDAGCHAPGCSPLAAASSCENEARLVCWVCRCIDVLWQHTTYTLQPQSRYCIGSRGSREGIYFRHLHSRTKAAPRYTWSGTHDYDDRHQHHRSERTNSKKQKGCSRWWDLGLPS